MRIRGKLITLSLILLGLLTQGLWAADPVPSSTTIYVDDTAPGLNNGTSWYHAYRSLQDALQAALPNTVIKVAQGTYSPADANGMSSLDRNATFELKNNVEILGGFAGNGMPFPGERLIWEYDTILDGDLLANDIALDPNNTADDKSLENHATRQDNCYSVVTSTSKNQTAILDGFIIKNGNANDPLAMYDWPYQKVRGGGLFIHKGYPTIKNCVLTLNAAIDAGAALCNYSSEPTIMNCIFVGNFTSGNGAAIYNTAAEPSIISCDFIMNSTDSGYSGGGIYSYDSSPLIDDCLFKNNLAGGSGGAIASEQSWPTVVNCVFIGNSVDWRGDGGAATNSRSDAYFSNCSFYGNYAGVTGGAMLNNFSTVTLNRCTFNGNIADESGGAVHQYASEPNYTNCVFSGNIADDKGGALSINDCEAKIVNCTFYDNNAPMGRGVACHNVYNNVTSFSNVIIHNSILWNDSNNIDIEDGSQLYVLYSDVSGGYPGPGNIGLNPRFANPLGWDQILGTPDDNLRILPSSPCIDAAQNYSVPANITKDRDGSTRFFDDANTPDTGLGLPFDPIVDMGAYEFGSVNPYADTNDVDEAGSSGSHDGGNNGGGNNGGGGLNQTPVANAGPDQLIFASINNTGQTTLDGTSSYDPEGALLNYSWNWSINGTTYMTTGATPVILLPVGMHTINLIVGDGQLISAVDQVLITVIQPLQASLTMFPGSIQRGTCNQIVYGIVNIQQTSLSAIDLSQLLTLFPGNVQAIGQSAYTSGPGTVGIIAQFDKDQITSANLTNGPLGVTVVGKFMTGQYFAGSDQVTIIDCP
ncbi:MAG: right-handed parallel beta-helix repeat-containing protein [Phycisphaerae bacterium]|nr:right-handed parallel beta-helix repeat-containing protein [Phycisphaerae bacterium]